MFLAHISQCKLLQTVTNLLAHARVCACVVCAQSMRREYEAVQAAKATQEDEMRALKDRMMLGVSKLCVCVRACV